MAKADIKSIDEPTKEVNKFTKKKLIEATRFQHNRDLLTAILSDEETYSISQVEAMITKFMKGAVK
ncbi:MAG: hypothetical protein ACRCW1_07825 [Anaerotignaceae bacterium]